MITIDTAFLGLLALVRMTAMLFTAPVLGHRSIPLQFRILLAVVLTAITFPMVQQHTHIVPSVNDWMPALSSELTVGLSLGLCVSIMFAAARMAGEVVSQMASIPMSFDGPEGASPVGQLFGVLSIAAFVLMGGPEMVITSTMDTFIQLPIGTSFDSTSISELLIEMLRQSFLLTLRGVAPAVGAMMISTIAMGVISRNYPQVNLLTLGLNTNLAVMMLALFFTLGGCVWLFVDDFQNILTNIHSALQDAGETASVAPLDQPESTTSLVAADRLGGDDVR